ncbi:serine/threonine-protein phosphatase 7 long form homolog [Hibiscus syriacus]|uniref:serine/threonine-protein phosphatase 7 long form homolog n=1 Tax=Hibiscus syriacus TaxID=106335 RepID=UPI00192481CE|nr:serine/threonine-protein phosphatase 7 long form homolog [Hibiscus syriacus]
MWPWLAVGALHVGLWEFTGLLGVFFKLGWSTRRLLHMIIITKAWQAKRVSEREDIEAKRVRHIHHRPQKFEDDEQQVLHPQLINCEIPDQCIVDNLKIVGFYDVVFVREFRLISGLINALIERWRPETHTFHLPCGEYTITLEDVALQLGVPINGMEVVGNIDLDVFAICERYLGKVPDKDIAKGSQLRLS